MKLNEKDQLVKDYFQLARKLGKMPTARETSKFICSENKYCRIMGSFGKLKQEAIKKYPDLEEFIMPAVASDMDIEDYKLNVEKKKRGSQNKTTLKDTVARDFIKKFAENIFSGRVVPYKIPNKNPKPHERALVLTLSDIHVGSDLKAEETGYLSYGKVEEARRIAQVIKQTIEYKPQYRKQTKLYVNMIGDLIQNKLHDKQDAAPIAEQCVRAIHLFTQALAQLAENFSEVEVHCATGNHARILDRHHSRATSGKWDSYETIIYYAIKTALSKYTNLKIHIPQTPYSTYEILGHKVFTTHSDTVFNVGNPGKALNLANIEKQVNKINASLKDNEEIALVFVGHTHCATTSLLGNGTAVITNGALTPIDQFCVSLGILEGPSSQTLVEVTKDYALGDIRHIQVDEETDKDSLLDKIIKPWSGF